MRSSNSGDAVNAPHWIVCRVSTELSLLPGTILEYFSGVTFWPLPNFSGAAPGMSPLHGPLGGAQNTVLSGRFRRDGSLLGGVSKVVTVKSSSLPICTKSCSLRSTALTIAMASLFVIFVKSGG
jgi:hypothetical protein